MVIIYSKDKQKVQELVDKILQEHPEYGEVTVISDLSELPENIKINEVVDTVNGIDIPSTDHKMISNLVGDMTKHLENTVEKLSLEDIILAYEETHKYYIPKVPNVEKFVEENKTEFQKLSSFSRKEKNQARKKLEHQALKYQNKHWKK